MNRPWKLLGLLVFVVGLSALQTAVVLGVEIVMKDGRVLRGKLGRVPGMMDIPMANPADAGGVPVIEFLDDELRRTFFSYRQVHLHRPGETGEVMEKIRIRQRILHGGLAVRTVGPLLKVEPFDQFGRRTVTMLTARGETKIVQGITELTPTYAKVEGVTHVWDMRIATSSIPHDILAKILAKVFEKELKKNDSEVVRRIARFYLQCDRYEEAAKELQAFLDANPDDAESKKQFERSLQVIKQLSAKRLLTELKLRRGAGQHRLAQEMLKKFPTDETAGETLEEVREILHEYEAAAATRTKILAQLDAIGQKLSDAVQRKRVEAILGEMKDGLSFNTLDRMAAYRQMADDATIPPADKLALAISGWLLGTKGAMPRLSTALSLVDVRRMIQKYLQTTDRLGRDGLALGFRSEEGASPALVARLLANMAPPVAAELPAEEGMPCEFEVPGPDSSSPAVRCLVQLPPEYDPRRRYPAIVTLHGPGYTSEQQIEWWAGPRSKTGWRAGQASRHGYIVVAPEWTLEHQNQYFYSAREHAAVLDSLRAACQRFSIDTDRVYLSGHSIGGDAAWDIGAAHPDLWAGVIPISARADKYCAFYWENLALLPFYFVAGELDSSRMAANSRDWDRYLRKGYNTTVVEYEGRGHENFSDEILRLFDWMSHLKRNYAPKEFTSVTMRPWDNFFWWVELRQLPARATVAPDHWPPPRGTLAMRTSAGVTQTNGIRVQTGAGQATVWLSPDVLDLSRRVTVKINGREISPGSATLAGDVAVILEDARTRGDRQHPFWSKVESSTGRAAKE